MPGRPSRGVPAGVPSATPGARHPRSASTAERVVLSALSGVLAAVLLVHDAGVLTPDTKPEVFLAPWRTLGRTVSAWQDSPFLGAANFNVGLAPVAVVTGLLDAAGLPPWLVVRVWRFALLLLAAAGARRLYADLTAGTASATAPGRVAAAVAYVATPYVLLGGATTPTLLPFALLPWFLLLLRRAFAAPRGWAGPAGAAVVFAAMGGINAGVVPVLQAVAVVPVALDALVREHRPWRDVARPLLRTGVFVLLLSAYWVVPALGAVGVGTSIAGTTESTSAVAATSSAAEVLRGLGMWPLYGADAAGPFVPGLLPYLGSPVVVVASFALPVLAATGALLSRSPVRLPAVGLLVVAVPVMVGLHPVPGPGGPDPTPLGRALGVAFEVVPGAVAFRTTNKAGAVLVLGLALLVALGAAAAAPRLRTRPQRLTAVTAAAAVAVTGTAPAWTGGLWSTRVEVPDYWRQAAAELDRAPSDASGQPTRVLLAPGVGLARYRWGYTGPDELGNSLFDRPTAYRSAVPAGTPWAANLLAGTDLRLQDGDLPPGALSTLARYLGAGDVLVRHDLVWELTDGARPAVVAPAVAADPGVRAAGTFGVPGERTTGPRGPEAGEAALPPLQRWAVQRPRGPVRQVAAAGAVVLDGDGEALPDLAARGELSGDPALLLAGATDDAALAAALGRGARIVLTDTNRRASWALQKLGNGTGPLLAQDADPAPSRALFGSDDQTVAVQQGTARVSAQGRGLLFGPVPYAAPALAVDRDPTTAWLTGNFGGGPGDAFVVAAGSVVDVPSVTLRLPAGTGRRISRVRVTVSGAGTPTVREQAVGPVVGEPTVVALPGARGDRVRVEVLAVAGPGFGPVGLAEVVVPGLEVDAAARTPVALAGRLDALARRDPQVRAALARTSVDVTLRRRQGSPTTAADDEEARMARDVTIPDSRSYTVAGTVRLSPAAADAVPERLQGRSAPVRARSSSRAVDSVASRSAGVVDVTPTDGRPDLTTAWVPADPAVGEWVEVAFPRRVVDGVTVTQPRDPGAARATRAAVSVDGGPGTVVDLAPGAVRVPLAARAASRVRVTLLGRVGSGPVRIEDVSVARVPAAQRPSTRATGTVAVRGDGCVAVALVDGRPLRVRPRGGPAAAASGRPVPFTACPGTPLRLGPGRHTLRPLTDWALDDLVLRDAVRPAAPASAPPDGGGLRVLHSDDTGRRLRTAPTGSAYYVVAGTGHDPGWRAAADGVDLGPPVVVDGYSAGWLVEDGRSHLVEIEYAPARRAIMAGAASLAGLLGCLAVVLRAAFARRTRDGRTTDVRG